MADLNRVTLIGRLTRDSELKYANTASGEIAVCRFSIAVNKFRKSGEQRTEEANFFDIVLWGARRSPLTSILLRESKLPLTASCGRTAGLKRTGSSAAR